MPCAACGDGRPFGITCMRALARRVWRAPVGHNGPMRCITPAEFEELFGKDGFAVHSNIDYWRHGLSLRGEIASQYVRVEGRPVPDVNRLAYFAQELGRWLPTRRRRLLWISAWNHFWPSAHALFEAARRGMGETRPLLDAPGHLFDAHDYDNQDRTEIPPGQHRDVSLLVGLMSLVMINNWDAWLLAEGSTDRVEFWEGNVLLYSDDERRRDEAEALLKAFGCPMGLQ